MFPVSDAPQLLMVRPCGTKSTAINSAPETTLGTRSDVRVSDRPGMASDWCTTMLMPMSSMDTYSKSCMYIIIGRSLSFIINNCYTVISCNKYYEVMINHE